MSLYRAPPTVLPSLAEDALAAKFPFEDGRYAPGTALDRASRAPCPPPVPFWPFADDPTWGGPLS